MTNINGGDHNGSGEPLTAAVSARTRDTYDNRWNVFADFCRSHRLTAFPASPDAVVAYLGAAKAGILRRPGTSRSMTGEPSPFSASEVDVTLAAIRDRHLRAELESPTDNPAVRQLRKQYRTDWHAEHRETRARPLTVDALRACVEYQPPIPLAALTKAVVALLLLDVDDARALNLSRLRLADLRCAEHVEVRLDGQWRRVSCTCTEHAGLWRARPCAACLLRLLEADLDVGELNPELFGGWPRRSTGCATPLRQTIQVLATTVPGLWPAVEYIGQGRLAWTTDDEDTRSATRHGLGLALTGQLHLLQIRVLLDVSFARGLRFSDAQRLALQSVTRQPEGYRILVPVSKGDQAGRGHWFHLLPASERALCPVCALDEWLWLRRAATPPADSAAVLVCGLGSTGFRPERRLEYMTTRARLRSIREGSGAGEFTLHSPRRGFAATAIEQGATVFEVQAALRHRKLDTTTRYIDVARHGEIPAGVQRLAGSAPAGRATPAPRTPPRAPHAPSDHRSPGTAER